ARLGAGDGENAAHGGADTLEQVLRRARHLRESELAAAIERYDVGEGAADVDTNLHTVLLGSLTVPQPPATSSPSGEVTGDSATIELAERRLLRSAHILGERTTRAKAAAARHRARVRRLALQGEVERDAAAADAGHRREQRLRVGMAGLLEDCRLVAVLD